MWSFDFKAYTVSGGNSTLGWISPASMIRLRAQDLREPLNQIESMSDLSALLFNSRFGTAMH